MNEKIYTLGRDNNLIGILTRGDVNLRNGKLPAVLLWNAGLLHRIGPYRLWVDMGREFASLGFNVFRFDISGNGDSESRRDDQQYNKRVIDDIQDTMDFLSSKIGVDKFILIGLCSGADEAHPVAVLDSRVSGVVFLDGYGYRTLGFYIRRYGLNVFYLRAWKNLLTRLISCFLEKRNNGLNLEGKKKEIFEREFPSKNEIIRDLKKLVNRGVNLFFVYSGDGSYLYYNYYGQFSQMFKGVDFKGKLKLEYLNESDHTYTRLIERNKLIKAIREWLQSNYLGC